MTDLRPFRFGVKFRRAQSGAALAERARQIEAAGYSTLLVSDHFWNVLAPLPTAMAIAAATSTLRVGTNVLGNDFRHPVLLAKEIATVDVLSDGRFELGHGAGWMADDYRGAGMTMDSPGVRIERAEFLIPVVFRVPKDEFVRTLEGNVFAETQRRGKVLIFSLESGHLLVINPMLTGIPLLTVIRARGTMPQWLARAAAAVHTRFASPSNSGWSHSTCKTEDV